MNILNAKKGKSTSFIKTYFTRKKNRAARRVHENFVEKYTPDYFKSLLDQNNSVLISPSEIKYNSFVDFGTPIQSFKNFYGKPEYSYNSPDNSDINTLVYKTKIKGVRAKCSLIFYKRKLVLFNYVFTNLSRSEYTKVMQYSSRKFGNRTDSLDYKIVDKNNNHLIIKSLKDEIAFNFYSGGVQQKFVFEKNKHEPDFVLTPNLHIEASS